MDKDIKDYLHLYKGCECEYLEPSHMNDRVRGIFLGYMDKHHASIENQNFGVQVDEIMLILRPLSDMTEMEIIKVLSDICKDIFTYSPLISNCTFMTEGDNATGVICTSEHNERYGLTVDVEIGVEFSIDSSQMKVNQFKYTVWLLKHGFDLFGLIEAGLAIDKTTLTNKT